MPTYSYACDACGHTFEREQRITEDPIKKCPSCGKLKARRMIAGAAGFILKGGGWYADLYSSKKADASPKPEASGETKSESATETKPETSGTKEASPKPTEASKPKKKAKE